MMATKAITREDWAKRFIEQLRAPVGDHSLWALVAWQAAEGGSIGARFNPLNTTERWPGSTMFNHVGVQNYLSLSDGLKATAKTIEQTNPVLGYAPILAHIRAEDEAVHILVALRESSWGTGALAVKILHDVKTFWDRDYAHVLIPQ